MSNFIKAILDRVEEDTAIIIADNGQQLLVNRDFIASDIKEGDAVRIYIKKDQEETDEKNQLAKSMLNEILNQ